MLAYLTLTAIVVGVALILAKLEKIMPTLAEVLASTQAEGVQVTALIAAFQDEAAKISDLSAQLTAALANGADPATVGAINDAIAAQSAAIAAVLPAAAPASPAS